MTVASRVAGKPRRATRLLFASLLLLLLNAHASRAQTGTGIDSDPSDGMGSRATARNTVQGYVTVPSGMRLDRRMKVSLSGSTGALFAFTDDNGAFVFRRLPGGTYYLTVDAGQDFEKATETVDVYSMRSGGTTQTVEIRLRPRSAPHEKPAAVSAALAAVPKPALKLYEKGLREAESGDHKKAVESFKGAVALYPEFTAALGELGVQYLLLNQFDPAAEALRSAVALAPGDAALRLDYGAVLYYQKKYPEAAEQLQESLSKGENSAKAHFYFGRTLVRLNRYADAEKELQRAVSLGGPEVNEAYRYLGAIYREAGDPVRAAAALEKYLTLEPKAADAAAIRQIISELRAQAPAKPK
jgi:Tfp pilus assembly protein PilF